MERLHELSLQVGADKAAHLEEMRRAAHLQNDAVASKAHVDNLVRERDRLRHRSQMAAENLASIEASLQRFGQAEPLVVQKSTGRVIGGNGRLVVMKKLGWAQCDVVELDVDDLTATSLGIALNRTAELAEWDEPVLAKLLKELREEAALPGGLYQRLEKGQRR